MKLILYSRNDCHLCEAFEEELKIFLARSEIVFKKIDVDEKENLKALYGNDVPVLTLNEDIICQHFFDKDKITKVLL